MNINDFYNGNEWNAHKYFGAHITPGGVCFRVYAPCAKKVTVIGDFNGWNDWEMPVCGRGGIYEITLRDAKAGDRYKYRIYHGDGSYVDKADPYGFSMELRPCSASVIVEESFFDFGDSLWMSQREKLYNKPFHIYEIHFGSWRAKKNRWYRYEELADELIPYLKEMGYTHVELLPINEHPCDESWGYQGTVFFAPTSRYGTPDGLKEFVRKCHQEGIGVILDFVMVHFAVDSYGLGMFDGHPLYELPFDDVMQCEWGSYNFAHGRGEVASYLKSCANYWLSDFHIDGLRIDAVSNIIYWDGNAGRGVNREALSFVQSFNKGLHTLHPGAILIAEDSTSYLKVTALVDYDGLGFDYKWDLGFMHDTLDFFMRPVCERREHYGDLLFSMHYFYNELYMLALSHDENVHGKKTILDKMYGSYEEKFANARCLYAYMMTHPGKKLNFMGNEIGQFREWAYYRPQDFEELAPFKMHQTFQRFFRDLNRIYRSHKALYEGEYNSACFRYIINEDRDSVVYGYERSAGGERIIVLMNLSDSYYVNYRVRYEGNHLLKELLHTGADIYGGTDSSGLQSIRVQSGHFLLDLPPFSCRIFQVN